MNHEDTFRTKLGAILFLTAIFYLNFTSRVVMGPLMPTVEKDLNLSHVQAGSLFLMITIGYFVTMVCSGLVTSRLVHRRIIYIAALSLGGAMIWVSLTHTLSELRWALIALGLAAGLYLPSAISTITSLFRRRNWGKALAVHELAPNLGLLSAPLLAELFIRFFTWRTTVAVLGMASVLIGLAFMRFGRGGDFFGEPPKPRIIKSLVRQKSVWIMAGLFSLGVGASLGVYNMLPLYMVEEAGLSRESANAWLAACRITGLFMVFFSGWVTDRIGAKTALFGALLAGGLSTLALGFFTGNTLVTAIFFQSALSSCFFPAGLAALSLIGRPSERGLVISLVVPLAFIVGGGLFPAIIGYFGEHHTFAGGMITTGILILTGPLLILGLTDKPETS